MDLKAALVRVGSLASKDEKAAYLPTRQDIPAGFALRSAEYRIFIELDEMPVPPLPFVFDAKTAAQVAKKANAKSFGVVTTHDVPTQFIIGVDPVASLSCTPCMDSEAWFPDFPAPDTYLKDVCFRALETDEARCFSALSILPQQDPIRPGLACLRFSPDGIYGGDEVHHGAVKMTTNNWKGELIPISGLQKLPAFKGQDGLDVGFHDGLAYLNMPGEKRIIACSQEWFPPIEQILPITMSGFKVIYTDVSLMVKFLRSIKTKAERRVVFFDVVPEGAVLLRGGTPETTHQLVEIEDCDPISLCFDGNRLLETLRRWPFPMIYLQWCPLLGNRTPLRLDTVPIRQHIFPMVPEECLL